MFQKESSQGWEAEVLCPVCEMEATSEGEPGQVPVLWLPMESGTALDGVRLFALNSASAIYFHHLEQNIEPKH